MAERTGSGTSFGKRQIVWILNIVVAILCLLSILCYFFGPVWQINLTYIVTADQVQELMPGDLNIDVHEVIGEEGEALSVSVSLSAGHMLGAFSSGEETVDKIIDSNVDSIVGQLTGTLNGVVKKMVKSAAKNTVKGEVKNNIKKFLTKDDGSEITDEEVNQKLNELGFTDEYISEKTDQLIDSVFEGGGDVDTVTKNIMDTVDDVYSDLQKNAEGKEGYEEFTDVELSAEDKAQIEESVRSTVEKLAQEDGSIDPDEVISELLAQALGSAGSGEGKNTAGTVLLADVETATSGKDKLASALKDKLNEFLSADVRGYAVYAFYGMAGLMFLSMLPWAYVLLKLIVKLVGKSKNPTVKLALPIWLGWLFFLVLVAIPSFALWMVNLPSLAEAVPALGNIVSRLENVRLSITSFSLISAICALIAFGISIYYMIVRKQLKRETSAPHDAADDEASDGERVREEEIAFTQEEE